MAAKRWSLVYMLIILCIEICWVCSEKILGEIVNDEFDFDGLPGATHEFKIEVRAGTIECFFQHIVPGAKLHISYEVLKGGDRYVDFHFRNPRFQTVEMHPWRQKGTLEMDIHDRGSYQFCLDNRAARFANKLVHVYLVTFIMEEWTKYANELQELQYTAENFTVIISEVQVSISEMLRQQMHSRMNVMKDWYLVYYNNQYVQSWSIFQCIIIILTSGLQVFFLRRLFNVKTVTPSSKPRA